MQKYIDMIKNEQIRTNTQLIYGELPDYFEKVAASSTGKYHPRFSLGEGGLLRHTQCAVEIAIELFRIKGFNILQEDIILSSLILHDGLKHGHIHTKYTIKDHAEQMADWLKTKWKDNYFDGSLNIISCIETHMGQWSIRREPETELEHFVHMCDYLASRKLYDKFYPEECKCNIQA
jgi:hypothetical protein